MYSYYDDKKQDDKFLDGELIVNDYPDGNILIGEHVFRTARINNYIGLALLSEYQAYYDGSASYKTD